MPRAASAGVGSSIESAGRTTLGAATVLAAARAPLVASWARFSECASVALFSPVDVVAAEGAEEREAPGATFDVALAVACEVRCLEPFSAGEVMCEEELGAAEALEEREGAVEDV